MPSGVVVVQPAYIARELAGKTDHRLVERLGGNSQSTERASREINRLYPDTYDFVTDDVAWLADRYHPDWVVFDVEKLEEMPEATGLEQPGSTPVYANDNFEVYRFADLT